MSIRWDIDENFHLVIFSKTVNGNFQKLFFFSLFQIRRDFGEGFQNVAFALRIVENA
jgi:hypothetical protein